MPRLLVGIQFHGRDDATCGDGDGDGEWAEWTKLLIERCRTIRVDRFPQAATITGLCSGANGEVDGEAGRSDRYLD